MFWTMLQKLYVKNTVEKEELLKGIIIGTKLAPPLPVLEKALPIFLFLMHDVLIFMAFFLIPKYILSKVVFKD